MILYVVLTHTREDNISVSERGWYSVLLSRLQSKFNVIFYQLETLSLIPSKASHMVYTT